MTYGGSAPTVTASYSGFVNGDSLRPCSPRAHLLDVGHVVQPGGFVRGTTCSGAADANYTITYVAGTVAIHAATLTITASSATVTYGNAARRSPRRTPAS